MKSKILQGTFFYFLLTLNVLLVGCGEQTDNTTLSANTAPKSPVPSPTQQTSLPKTFAVQLGAMTFKPGYSNLKQDDCYDVAIDSQKNMYCIGKTNSDMGEPNNNGTDAVIIKLDAEGNLVWIKQFGALSLFPIQYTYSGSEYFDHIEIDAQDNIYVLTHEKHDDLLFPDHAVSVLKLNTDGIVLNQYPLFDFEHRFQNVIPWSQIMTMDQSGYFYFAGYDNSGAYKIRKYTDDFSLVWSRTINEIVGSSASGRCNDLAVDQLIPANIYCGGWTEDNLAEPNAGDLDAMVLKINSQGQLIWAMQMGQNTTHPEVGDGNNSGNALIRSIHVNSDQEVICTGSGQHNINPPYSPYVIKLTSDGVIEWAHPIYSSLISPQHAYNTDITASALKSNGNITVVGQTSYSLGEPFGGGLDIFLMELSSSGQIVWERQFGQETLASNIGSNEDYERIESAVVDEDGYLYLGGQTYGNMVEPNADPTYILGIPTDIIMLKLSPAGQL